MLASIPLWVYIVIGFIFFSGYMAFRAMKAEYELEQQFIEKEGEVYIERIEKARKEKREKEKMRN
ncbi:MAG TPA: sporulation YhaL family protein [Bacillota bacterium]|nr:sporulation YhaL family protein [Bacillota bacterium]